MTVSWEHAAQRSKGHNISAEWGVGGGEKASVNRALGAQKEMMVAIIFNRLEQAPKQCGESRGEAQHLMARKGNPVPGNGSEMAWTPAFCDRVQPQGGRGLSAVLWTTCSIQGRTLTLPS